MTKSISTQGDRSLAGSNETPAHSSRALGAYEPSLDGLRWIAMSIMLAFHAGFAWGQGAAFSLSQFFTLSGFLITSLLLRARGTDGRLGLRVFWVKRFRRLMPAALLTLLGIVVFAIPFADGSQLAKLPGQVISALLYVVNWYFVFTDQSYVAQFASPSPVVHFWSLAVEEQFYVVMPLVLLVLLRRTSSMKVLAGFFAGAAVCSALWMITLYHWGASIDRLYYGTDTRAAEFLVGAALACWFAHRPLNPSELGRRVLAVASLVVLGITVWLWTSVPLTDPALYQGGFFVFSLLSATLITALLAGAGPLSRVFSWGPLPALGRITYGVYLVQWPIFLWLDEERMGLSRWPLLVFQLALIMGLATVMYHVVELPIRSGTMLRGRTALIVAPALGAAIAVGALVVSAGGEGDPLAPMAEVASDLPPEVIGDGVLSVLVIGDEAGQPVAERLVTAADEREGVEVDIGPEFGCGADPACQDWADGWSEAVEDVDPDVVVMLVTDWDRADMLRASGLGDDASDEDLQAWFETAMGERLDALTARGATVLWTPIDRGNFTNALDWWAPFGATMMGLPAEDARVQRILVKLRGGGSASAEGEAALDQAIDDILGKAAVYDRQVAGSGPRILLLGDSVAASLGVGLEQWAEETGGATVWTTAQLGCGIAYDGIIEMPYFGGQSEVPPHCRDIDERWAAQIERFDPDIVVVQSTVWDLVLRKLDEWDEFLRPGDPLFDEFILEEYIRAVDVLTAGGARLVWMDGVCTDVIGSNEDIDHLNEEILPALVEARPEVEIYPLTDLACPDGFTQTLGSIDDARPDDIHFSPEASRWLADRYAPDLVANR